MTKNCLGTMITGTAAMISYSAVLCVRAGRTPSMLSV